MKKVLISIVLGTALLATSGVASADQNRSAEPRWGIRPERSAAPSPLDFARWMARRLIEAVGVPQPEPSGPVAAPATTPTLGEGEEICTPERVHCPVG